LAKDDNRRAVSSAVTDRMRELGITVAEIRRRTGQSETTIHGVIRGKGRPTKSTLTLLSVGLDWQRNHLDNILQGTPHKNAVPAPPLEGYLAKIARELADINTLREDVSELKEVVYRMDE
jgi:cyanate lyase